MHRTILALTVLLLASPLHAATVSNIFIRSNTLVKLDDHGSTLAVTNYGVIANHDYGVWIWVNYVPSRAEPGGDGWSGQRRPVYKGWFVFVERRDAIWYFDGKDQLQYRARGLVQTAPGSYRGTGTIKVPKTYPPALQDALPPAVITKYFHQ